MCSMHSATDHLSGAGLKFHCASLRPFTEASTPFLLVSRYASAFSLSAGVASCARTLPATVRVTAAATTVPSHFRRFMISSPELATSCCGSGGAPRDFLGRQIFLVSCEIPVISPAIDNRAGAITVNLVGHWLQLRGTRGQGLCEDSVAVFHIIMMRDGARSPRPPPFAQFHHRIADAHLGVNDDTVRASFILNYRRSERALQKVQKARRLLHAEIRIEILENFRLVVFSGNMRRDKPEIASRVTHSGFAVAVVAVGGFVERGAAGLQGADVNLVGVLDIVVQARRYGFVSFVGVSELDDRTAQPCFGVMNRAVFAARCKFLGRAKRLLHELEKVRRSFHDQILSHAAKL